MNLHNEIMNIPTDIDFTDWPDCARQSYERGHSDARHAAAELSLKADARIEELESVLKGLLNEAHTASKPLHLHPEWAIKAMKVLETK